MEDIYIIQGIRQGDELAFRHLYEEHYVLLCHFANQMLHDAPTAEEMVQDVICYLWEHHDAIDIQHSIRAYLLRAVRNRCLRELKNNPRIEEICFSSFFGEENLSFIESLFVDDSHPLGSLLERELEEEVYRSIELLPSECRTVFKKSRMENKTYEEIAAELDISVNTVKYHIKNALSILQHHLNDYLKLLLIYFFMEK